MPALHQATHADALAEGRTRHVVYLYRPDAAWLAALLPFVRAGLAERERCVFVVDDALRSRVQSTLHAAGLTADQVGILDAADWYLAGGAGLAEHGARALRSLVAEALSAGYTGVRVVADLSLPLALGDLRAVERAIHEVVSETPARLVCACDLTTLPEAARPLLVESHQAFAQMLRPEDLEGLRGPAPSSPDRSPSTWSGGYGAVELGLTLLEGGGYFRLKRRGDEAGLLPAIPDLALDALLEAALRDAALAARNATLERTVVEARLAREQAAAIIESSADGILVVDRHQRVVAANPALQALTGFTPAELQGRTCKYLLGANGLGGGPLCDTVCPFLHPRGGHPRTVDAEMATKDGRRIWVNVAYGAIYDAAGRVEAVVHTIRDIGERKELEIAKDQFLSIVNHEIKGPVTSAKGYVQVLLSRLRRAGTIDGAGAGQLQAIDRQLSRISAMVDRLLDVSRAQLGRLSIHPEPMDLSELISQVVEQLQVTTQGHALEVEVDEPLPGQWDPVRLEEVLTNLVQNAVKYSPDGGRVVVGARREPSQVVVWVRDQGLGISAEAQRRLFEPYYRAREARRLAIGGLGLGLYISQEIVAAHGGRIWVESEEGQGSTFSFSLPLAGPS